MDGREDRGRRRERGRNEGTEKDTREKMYIYVFAFVCLFVYQLSKHNFGLIVLIFVV